MTVVAFCLPLIVGLGWYCAAEMEAAYKSKGFARKKKEFHRWFLAGMLFWLFLLLLSLTRLLV